MVDIANPHDRFFKEVLSWQEVARVGKGENYGIGKSVGKKGLRASARGTYPPG